MLVLCSAARLQAPRCSAGAPKQQQRRQVQQAAPATAPLHRQLLSGGLGGVAAAALLLAAPAHADFPGIESIELPSLDISAAVLAQKAAAQSNLDAADAAFQQSDLLKELLERSDANRVANRKAIEDKYCQRGAESGVGDCGGLRFIPGMTKNGAQVRPAWMEELAQKMGIVEP